MLRLQVHAPGYLVLKIVVVFLQNFDGVRVGHMAEFRIQHMIQTIQQPFVDKGVEEIHLLRRFLQHVTDDVFQHALRQRHVIVQIRKGNLRLNHPELRRVAGGVGILRTESRAKGVDIAESLGIGLTV